MPPSATTRSEDGRLSFGENVGFALGDTASNFFFQTFGIFLMYYYTDVFGIPAAVAGTMFLVTRLFDAVTDPLMGMIADRTKTRWGKYRPYLLWMAIPYGICGYLIFANPDLDEFGKIVYAYFTYSLMMLAYTAINVPYSSLMAVLSPSSRARTVASSFRFVGAFGGGLLVSLFVRPLVKALGGEDEVLGFQYTMALFAVASVLLFWITFASTKERVQPPPGQVADVRGELRELIGNRPWVMLFLANIFSITFIVLRGSVTIHYFKYCAETSGEAVFWVLDEVSLFLGFGMFMMMVGALCMGFVSRVIDKKSLAVWLTFGSAACLAAFYFVPSDQYLLLLLLHGLNSLMMGPTSAIVWSMYGDVADYGEHRYGRRSTGLIHSASLFSLKTGSALAGALGGWLLGWFGFEANVVQDERAMFGILLLFSLIPAGFAVGKGLALLAYPLDAKSVLRIEGELALRRADHAQ